ncbi:putative periplasmic protein, partial [Reticulomyxa filosa]
MNDEYLLRLEPGAQIEIRDDTKNTYKNSVDAVRLNKRLKKNKFLKNVRNDFYQFNKLTKELDTMIRRLNGENSTYTAFQSDLNQTMTNTFKWKLSFFEELAKSKSNMDTLILDTNLLQNMIEDLPKNINKNNN